MRYVIDACVAVKWLVSETHEQEACRYLFSSIKRYAPEFIYMEVANAMRKKVLTGDITAEDARRNVQNLQAYDLFEIASNNDLLDRSLSIANTIRHPLYDCLYLALAERAQAPLVTADQKFFDRIRANFSPSLVVWVEEAPIESP